MRRLLYNHRIKAMTDYIHDLPDWPTFGWKTESLTGALADLWRQQGRLMGQLQALGFPLQQDTVLRSLTDDVQRTSEIEGEHFRTEDVRSSVARRLGIDIGGYRPASRQLDAVVDMLIDATSRYDQPLTAERLFEWHMKLFPGQSGSALPRTGIRAGAWRDDSTGPMRVISGPIGRERVHFEAPAADRLDREMSRFLDWFNTDHGSALDPVLKAGIAHFWFVTIHPFDDGNGRIARAIADMSLARWERSPQRFYSMSAQILRERATYYTRLEHSQRGTLDITPWLTWFAGCLNRAIESSLASLGTAVQKAQVFQTATGPALNDRQRQVLNRLIDGFEGQLSSSKWAALAKCSSDTALRDISDLVERGILVKNPGAGRGTSYRLA
jgi:Fic family protein